MAQVQKGGGGGGGKGRQEDYPTSACVTDQEFFPPADFISNSQILTVLFFQQDFPIRSSFESNQNSSLFQLLWLLSKEYLVGRKEMPCWKKRTVDI